MDYLASLPIDDEPEEGRRCEHCSGYRVGPKTKHAGQLRATFEGNGISTPTIVVKAAYCRHHNVHDHNCPSRLGHPFARGQYSVAYDVYGRELGEYQQVIFA
jgi:hypothetical protein